MSKSNVRVELNLAGINAMMKSAEIAGALQAAGEAVASAAGTGYAASTHQASWVAITNVYATDKKASKDNRDNNTLLKAVGAVGLPQTKPSL